MIDVRSRSVLWAEAAAADFGLDRFGVRGICVKNNPGRFADFSTRQRPQQLRGFSARVVYNGRAGLQKKRLEKKR